MRRIAVIDSSPLINLVHLELGTQLVQLFDLIHVPRQVQVEVNRKSKFRRRLNKLYSKGFVRRCFVGDSFRMLYPMGRLGAGEAEVIQQAQSLEATHLVLDDENARKIGGKMKQLRPIGTVGILARLERQGFAKDTRDLVEKLRRDLGFRIADRLVEDAIEKATFLI